MRVALVCSVSPFLLSLVACGGTPAVDIDASVANADSGSPDADNTDAGPPPPTGSPGALDTTFGSGGIVTELGFGANQNNASAVVVQSDQRIVVGGGVMRGSDATIFVVRLLENGAIDQSFGSGGATTMNLAEGMDEQINTLALQSDGKILIGSTANNQLTILRLGSDGILDTTFGTDGFTLIDGGGLDAPYAILIDGAGNIVVIGTNYDDALVARLDASGQPDASFHGGTPLLIDAGGNDSALSGFFQSNGSIVIGGASYSAAGSRGFVARVTTAGQPDTTFGTGGRAVSTALIGTTVMPDTSGILLAGSGVSEPGFVLSRFTFAGAFDTTFATAGVSMLPTPGAATLYGAVLGANHNIYGVGTNNDFVVGAWLPDGSPDIAFGPGNAAVTAIGPDTDFASAITLTPDGRLVVCGSSNSTSTRNAAVVRYFP